MNGTTPHGGSRRGFEHLETAAHGAIGPLHYSQWLLPKHPEAHRHVRPGHRRLPPGQRRGRRRHGAPQVKVNPIERGIYHTDWVADRTIDWLDSLDAGDDWFCWMSFPDPHHPWDPPESEVGRIDWREVPLPAGYPEDRAAREAIIDAKPRHWRAWYDGTLVSNYEAPADWVPATLTADQVREVNARNAVEVELIDEALGRVLDRVGRAGLGRRRRRGRHHRPRRAPGRLRPPVQGPVPRGRAHAAAPGVATGAVLPGRRRATAPSVVHRPVGLVDLAPTFCAIAGIEPPEWMQGAPLPVDDADAGARGFDKVLTEWDSELFGVDVHLRTMFRDRWVVPPTGPAPATTGPRASSTTWSRTRSSR